MPNPNWNDEDNDMHPTCQNASGGLSGQQVAFLAQIKNKDILTFEEQEELRMIWYEVENHSYFPDGIPNRG